MRKVAIGIIFILFISFVVFRSARRGITPPPPAPPPVSEAQPTSTLLLGPGDHTLTVPGFVNRDYHAHVPPGYDPAVAMAVLMMFHGGGGNAEDAPLITCPNADPADPKCLNALADREGFIVVYPSGSRNPNPLFKNKAIRTWNAGGGKDGYVCVSGYACEQNFDDVGYFRALLNNLQKVVTIDRSRVYVTGISNGAAMSHRLACELSDRITAIAPIAFGNQFSGTAACNPSRPVPVIEFHGTKDPFATYDGGQGKNPLGQENGLVISVPKTVDGWAARNGCTTSSTVELPDITKDGTTVTKISYANCRRGADVVLYRVNGGGHVWPGGSQYLPASITGKTTRNINANELMWEFFKMHPMR